MDELAGSDRAAVPDGYVLVPIKPTQKMLNAAWAAAHEEKRSRGMG